MGQELNEQDRDQVMGYWIAVVDDEPLSLTNAKNMLHSRDMRVSCLRSGEDLLLFMEKNAPDLILLDILMPEMDGFDTYRALRKYEKETGRAQVPVIFLTGEDSSEAEKRGLKAGASDFIHKPFDEDILVNRIRNTITNNRTIESLTEEATMDKLTGFLNKMSGTERVSGLCRERSGALMILDLDNFKLVNDLYGHDMGDRFLVAFAEILNQNVRSDDILSRIGGDEFLGFFTGITNEEDVASLTARLNEELTLMSESLMGKDHGIPLGISTGTAFSSPDTGDYQILFRCADSALYEAKRSGKHGYAIYDPGNAPGTVTDDVEGDLSRVIMIMSERSEGKGALLLGLEAFSWNYRFIERFLVRYGGSAARVLFSLSSDEEDIIFSEMVSEFGNTLQETLRRTDIILRWKQDQYFIIMPQIREADVPKVIDRIMGAWGRKGYFDRLSIKHAGSILRKDRYEPKK